MRTLPWSMPSLGDMVMHPDEFRSQWKSLDKSERAWIREAAYEGRRDADPALRALVAAYAWRELRRQPVMWTAYVALLIVLTFGLILVDVSPVSLVVSAGMPALQMFYSRRLAVALMKNATPTVAHAATG